MILILWKIYYIFIKFNNKLIKVIIINYINKKKEYLFIYLIIKKQSTYKNMPWEMHNGEMHLIQFNDLQ